MNPLKGLGRLACPRGIAGDGAECSGRAVPTNPQTSTYCRRSRSSRATPWPKREVVPSIGIRLQPLSATTAHPPGDPGRLVRRSSPATELASNAGAWALDRIVRRRGSRIPPTTRLAGNVCTRNCGEHALARNGRSCTGIHRQSCRVRPTGGAVWRWWGTGGRANRPTGSRHKWWTDFLASGPPPVFDRLRQHDELRCAGRADVRHDSASIAAGAACVVSSKPAGPRLDVVGDDAITIGDVPYDWLFPQVAAVAHHCGAGTAAAALRAGVPTIAIPGLGDQPFWARRLPGSGRQRRDDPSAQARTPSGWPRPFESPSATTSFGRSSVTSQPGSPPKTVPLAYSRRWKPCCLSALETERAGQLRQRGQQLVPAAEHLDRHMVGARFQVLVEPRGDVVGGAVGDQLRRSACRCPAWRCRRR